MTKIKSNIEELRKIINEDNFKQEEALEFLEAIEIDVDDMDEEITDLKDDVRRNEESISELQSEIGSMESENLNTIECGIDVIEYKTPSNLVLQDVMENLEEAIKSSTPKEVNELLMKFIKQPA